MLGGWLVCWPELSMLARASTLARAAPLAKSLNVCHTFKVGSCLSPDTFWVCFRASESLKEPESDSYGFAMAQKKTTKLI
jgi:hypothetical protein